MKKNKSTAIKKSVSAKKTISKKTAPAKIAKSTKPSKSSPKSVKKKMKVEEASTMNLEVNQMESGKHHDIIQMILDDHKPLKRCIEILKNSEMNLSSRRAAFNEFAPLLLIHAKAEEAVLYAFEKTEVDMREDAFEGDVEHALAEQMVEDVKQSVDKDIWSAKAKVLAELVEHHIKEEESEMFPELKKEANASELIRLGEDYLAEKNKIKGGFLHPSIQREDSSQTVRH